MPGTMLSREYTLRTNWYGSCPLRDCTPLGKSDHKQGGMHALINTFRPNEEKEQDEVTEGNENEDGVKLS